MVKIFLLTSIIVVSVTFYILVDQNIISLSSHDSNTIHIPSVIINLKDDHRLQLKLNLFFKNKDTIHLTKKKVPLITDSMINYFRRLTKEKLFKKTLDDVKEDLAIHIHPFVTNTSFECLIIEEFLIS
jgi:hypothetical protein